MAEAQYERQRERVLWSTEIAASIIIGGFLFGPIGAFIGATGVAGYLYRHYGK